MDINKISELIKQIQNLQQELKQAVLENPDMAVGAETIENSYSKHKGRQRGRLTNTLLYYIETNPNITSPELLEKIKNAEGMPKRKLYQTIMNNLAYMITVGIIKGEPTNKTRMSKAGYKTKRLLGYTVKP